jgi:hypothetical protein
MQVTFAKDLERLLESWRLHRGQTRQNAHTLLEEMAKQADRYFDNLDPPPAFGAQSALPILLKQYGKASERKRKKLLEDFSAIANHAYLYRRELAGPPTTSLGGIMHFAILAMPDRLQRTSCICCMHTQSIQEGQLFCVACQGSQCRNSSIAWRWIIHWMR